jgi:hypothetical protein
MVSQSANDEIIKICFGRVIALKRVRADLTALANTATVS